MKKLLLSSNFLIISLLTFIAFFFQYCNSRPTPGSRASGVAQEERQVIGIAKDTAVKVYGWGVIQNELPLIAKLKNDSVWTVVGTLKSGFKGGTVYVEILRDSMKIVKITHYK
ncbi:YbbC/YhhH family protein [Chitinophaga sedimenti]|uniref:NTF2 fold immunity protein n=1 Tax=Chitinophaga sedimenti TaxID=2033606 RepID=UPI0020055D40|nr:NTF2 fold immunity protein [Chitinophaga sedimenti]MCK7560236.1 YbbC/YhhH family protein [Chitinophaga sedimenti]